MSVGPFRDKIFVMMVIVIVLFWILVSTKSAHGHDQLYQVMHDTVATVIADLDQENEHLLDKYLTELGDVGYSVPTAVIMQATSTSMFVLDLCGVLQKVVNQSVSHGFYLSSFLECWYNSFGKPPIVNHLDTFSVSCDHDAGFESQDDKKVVTLSSLSVSCVSYNLTLTRNKNGTMIEAVTIRKCGGTTLRSYIPDSVLSHLGSQFCIVKKIFVQQSPITELTVKDLMHFPALETLDLYDIPITLMDNGLLCNNLNITILQYVNSFGSLREFPHQIFNCTTPLKLEFFYLEMHNIAHLPAYAFGNAGKQLKIIILHNIGLKVIHENAFKGLLRVQLVSIKRNKLSQMSDTVLLPSSTDLHVLWINELWYTGALNLTTIGVERHSQLHSFKWTTAYVSKVVGNFCSNTSHSELKMIQLDGNFNKIETLPSNIFKHCGSLKFLSLTNDGLIYLPQKLFAAKVSHVEILFLMGNRLNSNTSWDDVLKPLHELKYLNLSDNMLTSWTYNLSSLWSLKMLDLSYNSITSVSHTAFRNMTVLKFLSLMCNKLAILTPAFQSMSTHIPMLYLSCNNISFLNMSEDTMTSDTNTLDVSSNNLIQLDLPFKEKCTSPCGKLLLFGDNNVLPWFSLLCSNTQKYATVSLTNNRLTNFEAMFPDVVVQQCSVEILNVSGNHF